MSSRLPPASLPPQTFRCQSVSGRHFLDGCWQRYKQAKRHCLGHIDLGYSCWKSWTKVCMPLRFRILAAMQASEVLLWAAGAHHVATISLGLRSPSIDVPAPLGRAPSRDHAPTRPPRAAPLLLLPPKLHPVCPPAAPSGLMFGWGSALAQLVQ